MVAFFHHPPFSSGPHGGASADPVPGTGVKAPDRVETQTTAIRNLYMPLFRKHHVRMIVAGHDHLYDHWVERYEDQGTTYRMDTIVTGGGGAPIITYNGEPDLRAYLAASAAAGVKVEHMMKPGPTVADNPHHFVAITVDGDRLSLEVIGTGAAPYTPYPGGVSKVTLADKRSGPSAELRLPTVAAQRPQSSPRHEADFVVFVILVSFVPLPSARVAFRRSNALPRRSGPGA